MFRNTFVRAGSSVLKVTQSLSEISLQTRNVRYVIVQLGAENTCSLQQASENTTDRCENLCWRLKDHRLQFDMDVKKWANKHVLCLNEQSVLL